MKLNNKSLLKLLLIPSTIVCLASCSALVVGGVAAAGGGTVVDDQSLEHKVNQVLSAQIPKGSFTVASYDQNILLAGQVPTNADKTKANSAAANTVGVKKVWNYLNVGTNEDAGDITTDAYLTTAAKSRLIAQKDVNTNNIKVVTSNGIVYLLGKQAGKADQIQAASVAIKGINKVRGVVNLIGQ